MTGIPAAEVTAAIEAASGHRVADLERRPSRYAKSAPLEEVHAELSDGTALRLVLKDLTPDSLVPGGRAKPRFLRDPARELAVYGRLLPRAPRGTARCYAATVSDGRYWLLLEHVPGVELHQVGDLDLWCDAARWLARLHAQTDLAEIARCRSSSRTQPPTGAGSAARSTSRRVVGRGATCGGSPTITTW
ncbi:MAG: hypothetical protein ACRDUY_13955 [Nitriliruptorales bacterium]